MGHSDKGYKMAQLNAEILSAVRGRGYKFVRACFEIMDGLYSVYIACKHPEKLHVYKGQKNLDEAHGFEFGTEFCCPNDGDNYDEVVRRQPNIVPDGVGSLDDDSDEFEEDNDWDTGYWEELSDGDIFDIEWKSASVQVLSALAAGEHVENWNMIRLDSDHDSE